MPERQTEVIETEVDIQTQDGTCNAVFFHPATGSLPAGAPGLAGRVRRARLPTRAKSANGPPPRDIQ